MKIFKAQKSKDITLEAVRGIAALVVVTNHSLTAFLPQSYGLIPSLTKDNMQGSVFYVFMNGAAAVCLFFVLSGYVLTRHFCDTADMDILVRGAVKRWPRLMGPILVTVMVSYSLFYFNLYHFAAAGARSGSKWLSEFGDGFVRIWPPNATVQSIHFRNALEQGAFLTLFRGDWLYDGSFWTMRLELLGSFIAFGAAPLLLYGRKFSSLVTVWLVALLVVMLNFPAPDLTAFPIGVGMAVLLPHGAALKRRYAFPAILLAFYLLGYGGKAIGAYAVFGSLAAQGMPYVYPETVGAAILICVVETFPPIRRIFSGRISAFLGGISFPIYLLHCLVICSIGSWIYLRLGAVPAIGSVFAISILVSLPLMMFNEWWIRQVNRLADRLLRPRGGAPAYRAAEIAVPLRAAPSRES